MRKKEARDNLEDQVAERIASGMSEPEALISLMLEGPKDNIIKQDLETLQGESDEKLIEIWQYHMRFPKEVLDPKMTGYTAEERIFIIQLIFRERGIDPVDPKPRE